MGRCPNNKAGGQKKRYSHKSARLKSFLKKGDDIIYDELKKISTGQSPTSTAIAVEHISSTGNVKYDSLEPEDLPGLGRHYCLYCDRHFANEEAITKHSITKGHKKRVKAMQGERPHSQIDADVAGGMGRPDNGPKLRASHVPVAMAIAD